MTFRLTLSALFGLTLIAHAQLFLNPGDTWTGAFSTMSGPTYWQIPTVPGGYIRVSFQSRSDDSVVAYEMFEGTISNGLIASNVITIQGNGAFHSEAWQDRTGTIRLRSLSGSCAITSVQAEMVQRNPGNPANWRDIYNTSLALTSAPPKLAIQSVTNGVAISWWANGAAGYVLESTNVLTSTNPWPAVASVPTLSSNRQVVTGSINGQAYFRLRK